VHCPATLLLPTTPEREGKEQRKRMAKVINEEDSNSCVEASAMQPEVSKIEVVKPEDSTSTIKVKTTCLTASNRVSSR
jgi:hypothetical protein